MPEAAGSTKPEADFPVATMPLFTKSLVRGIGIVDKVGSLDPGHSRTPEPTARDAATVRPIVCDECVDIYIMNLMECSKDFYAKLE